MFPIPGHLALAASTGRVLGVSVTGAILGTFAPDVIDKGLNDILHITPYGRHLMHSVAGCVVCSCLVGLSLGRAWGWGWFAGHFSHLLADLGTFIPLWMPFIRYEWPPDINVTFYVVLNPLTHLFSPEMGVEMLMLLLAVVLFRFGGPSDRVTRNCQYGCFAGILMLSALRVWLAVQTQ